MKTLTSKRLATWLLTPVLLLTLLSGMGALAAEHGAPGPPTGETTTEPTEEEQPAPEVRKAPQRAAGDKYGYASFQFHQSGVKAIYLHIPRIGSRRATTGGCRLRIWVWQTPPGSVMTG
mgnify:CR=1 FL=1